jgi:hypothetical protein
MDSRGDFGLRIADLTRSRYRYRDVEVDKNYKSQNPNHKQITITEIQNPKPSHHLKKIQICLGH